MIFTSMNHVPKRLRKLRGTPLSMLQVEAILTRAGAISNDEPSKFASALADARKEFTEANVPKGGIWQQKAGS